MSLVLPAQKDTGRAAAHRVILLGGPLPSAEDRDPRDHTVSAEVTTDSAAKTPRLGGAA